MVLRSWPRCRAIAEIVQPRRWSACASTSSSRVIMRRGGPFGLPVVRDQQPRRDLRHLGGATRVGKFSEQVWGDSHERRQLVHHPTELSLYALGKEVSGVEHHLVPLATQSAVLRRVSPACQREVGQSVVYGLGLSRSLLTVEITAVPLGASPAQIG